MRKPEELNYNLICSNCVRHCNYALLEFAFRSSQGVKIWKCKNFSPSVVFDRQTLKNQLFLEEKQIDRHYRRLRKM